MGDRAEGIQRAHQTDSSGGKDKQGGQHVSHKIDAVRRLPASHIQDKDAVGGDAVDEEDGHPDGQEHADDRQRLLQTDAAAEEDHGHAREKGNDNRQN
ncbi:hypothetical protein D3C75_948440 [compost metagenome]